jgi:ATP phosphoribosyltransferase
VIVLKLVLPKGSLEKATLELFSAADLGVERSSDVDYRASVDDPRISEVRILRPQEIPTYVEAGLFDFGITGRDWIEETGADVVSLGELQYSKATTRPIKLVLAVPAESHVKTPSDLRDGVRVSTEYPSITKRYFKDLGVEVEVVFSYGATEAKVPEIADAVVEITETGKALRAAGLSIIDTILVSHTEVIANKDVVSDPLKLHAIEQLMTLLQGTLAARSRVLVKLNVAEEDLDVVIGLLPSMKAPTISKLYGDLGYAVEAVVPRHTINTLIPALKDHGASDILEIPLSKIVP